MTNLPVFPAFKENNIAITLQTSEYFAPYASVTILSIIEHTSPEYNYDILVMTWDMQEETVQKLLSLADGRSNVSVRVVDVSKEIAPYQEIAKKRADYNRFSAAGVIRLILPELMEEYDLMLSMDSDMLVYADVAELFQYDMSDYYMGGVQDVICYVGYRMPSETYFTEEYVQNSLGLPSMDGYCNGGLLLLNLDKIRSTFQTKDIIEFATYNGTFRRIYEQDTFNGLFYGKKLYFPMEWNYQIDSISRVKDNKYLFPSEDKVIQDYYASEGKVKVYHYLTKFKPWQDTSMDHAEEWWEFARKTPFIDEIVSRIIHGDNQKDKPNAQKYLLFYCDTPYQLINAINIKLSYYSQAKADIILTHISGVYQKAADLEKLNIFNKVLISAYCTEKDKEIFSMSISQRVTHPERFFDGVELHSDYTDYFLPVPGGLYAKMVYYRIVKTNPGINVHIYEEGWSTYTDKLKGKLARFIDDSSYHGDQRILNRTKSIFLYKPGLYSGDSKLPKIIIPEIKDKSFVGILYSLFGKVALPKEKYIYLNENFAELGYASNDIQILDNISDIVGKENIIVKMHPLSKNRSLYQMHGYKIMNEEGIPWEVYLIADDMGEKTLISISSAASLAPYIVTTKNIYSISLLDVMKLSKRWNAGSPEYRNYMSKCCLRANRKEKLCFCPRNLAELRAVVEYIEGEW